MSLWWIRNSSTLKKDVMSKKQNKTEKVLEKLSKSFDLEVLKEEENGSLTGGFSDAVSEDFENQEDINIFKCYCGTKPPETSA